MLETIGAVVFSKWGFAALCIVAGVAFKKFLKYKKLFKELWDVGGVLVSARSKKGPGGKSITRAEREAILKEMVEVLQEAAYIVPKSWRIG